MNSVALLGARGILGTKCYPLTCSSAAHVPLHTPSFLPQAPLFCTLLSTLLCHPEAYLF